MALRVERVGVITLPPLPLQPELPSSSRSPVQRRQELSLQRLFIKEIIFIEFYLSHEL